VMYAIAVWRPNHETLESLQRIILRPLRLVLGLPRSTPTNDVLAEFNLPPLERARDMQLLTLEHRFAQLPAGHLAADQFRSLREPAALDYIPAVAPPYDFFVRERSRRPPPKQRRPSRSVAAVLALSPVQFVRFRSVSSE